LTTYGRSSGFCLDPVEKKALNHYLPGTPVLSFGTSGCNWLQARQNWDTAARDDAGERASPEDTRVRPNGRMPERLIPTTTRRSSIIRTDTVPRVARGE
jgi:pyruvate-formate lyase-activating enzyme